MRGVGDHLALRVGGALQGVEGGVVGAAEAAELVVLAVIWQAPGEVGAARDRLRLGGEAGDRSQRGTRDERAEQRRESDAAGRDDGEDQQQLAQDAVDFVKRPGDLHGAAAVKRLGEHPQVVPGNRLVLQAAALFRPARLPLPPRSAAP